MGSTYSKQGDVKSVYRVLIKKQREEYFYACGYELA
jgi:hypothetical protein